MNIKREISLIAAVAKNNVIGNNGTLPWHLKKDFAWFVKQTTGNIIVMGRKNYEDIIKYSKGKPLKDRINVVISTQNITHEGFIFCKSLDEVLLKFPKEKLMIIGGTTIYNMFLPYATQLILTEIDKEFKGDTYFPDWDKKRFKKTYSQDEHENGINYQFCIYDLK